VTARPRIITEPRFTGKLSVAVELDVQTAGKFIRFWIKPNCVASTVDLFVITRNHDQNICDFIYKINRKIGKKNPAALARFFLAAISLLYLLS
jgi:hypothetical protein